MYLSSAQVCTSQANASKKQKNEEQNERLTIVVESADDVDQLLISIYVTEEQSFTIIIII